jgi:hypothetical protein
MTARLRKDALGTGVSGTPPPPPAAQEADPIVHATPVTPQGGEGGATRDADEATQPDAAPVAAAEPHASYEMHDIGIDEMWKPEHKGKWAP